MLEKYNIRSGFRLCLQNNFQKEETLLLEKHKCVKEA